MQTQPLRVRHEAIRLGEDEQLSQQLRRARSEATRGRPPRFLERREQATVHERL